jgi:hypothetical protein
MSSGRICRIRRPYRLASQVRPAGRLATLVAANSWRFSGTTSTWPRLGSALNGLGTRRKVSSLRRARRPFARSRSRPCSATSSTSTAYARTQGLVFGRSAETPFDPRTLARRAETAWKRLEPISLHECRHVRESHDCRGCECEDPLSTSMGHSSITITLDRYGHLMPGNEEEGAALLDAYLERSNTAARLAQIERITSRTNC